MPNLKTKDDAIILESRQSWFLRCVIAFFGFQITWIGFARLAFFGIDDSLWGSLFGIAMIAGAVNFTRELRLCKRERLAEQRTTVFWPVSLVETRLSEFTSVVVRAITIQRSGRKSMTHRVHLISDDANQTEFLLGSWAFHREARGAAIQIARFLELSFIDECSDQTEKIEADEYDLTETELIRKGGEMEFPDRPEEMVTRIEFDGEQTKLCVPASGLPSLTLESCQVVGAMLVGWAASTANAIADKPDAWFTLTLIFFVPIVVAISFTVRSLILQAYKEEEITIGDSQVTIEKRRPFGFGTTVVHDAADVRSVSVRNSLHAPNGKTTVDGSPPQIFIGLNPKIVVSTANGETQFGAALTREERRYVCTVIRAAVAKSAIDMPQTSSATDRFVNATEFETASIGSFRSETPNRTS